MLEREGKFYNREVAVLDTIDNVARRTFTRAVLADSLIRVRSLADTARLSFSLDVEPGDYQLSLRYLVDSLDRNDKGLKGSVWLERRDSTRTGVYTTTLRRNREETFSRRFTVDSSHRRLRIDFLNFTGKPQRPSVTVRRTSPSSSTSGTDTINTITVASVATGNTTVEITVTKGTNSVTFVIPVSVTVTP